MYTEDNIDLLRTACLSQEVILVCDESFKNGYGAAAYIITTTSTLKMCAVTGNARTTGHPAIQDSYRAELTEILAGLLHFQTLLDLWKLHGTPLKLKVVCDNIEALKVSFNTDLHPSISAKYNHYDLLHSIRTFAWDNVIINYKHAYGHQDQKSRQLSMLESLNVDMDISCCLAREHLKKFHHPDTWVASLPNWKYIVVHNDQIIWKHFENTISNSISSNKMQKICCITLRLVHINLSVRNASEKQWQPSKVGVVGGFPKHNSRMCNVRKWRKIWKDREDNCCPRCSQPEDVHHVHLCKGQWSYPNLGGGTDYSLNVWLDKINTDPNTTTAILCCLKIFYKKQSDYDRLQLVLTQQTIGFDRFFEGELHKDWAIHQIKYYASVNSQRSGKAWCTILIIRLWDIRWISGRLVKTKNTKMII